MGWSRARGSEKCVSIDEIERVGVPRRVGSEWGVGVWVEGLNN